jgi:hypothetical protein
MGIYINKFDYTGKMGEKGAKAENNFLNIISEKFRVVPASFKEQTNNHIDYYVYDNKNRYFTVDVKARKKFTNEDEDVWIEFKNVRGKSGWLYGSATMIAFERKDDFVLVGREKLKKICEELVDLTDICDRDSCLYKAYTRKGRQDVLSKIKFTDIFNNINCIKLSKKRV